MSYLPRMSSTYKEPQALLEDEPEELTQSGTVQPASALANEKTHNPQIALKHYKYHPHPLPVLPGPSVTDEANENELFREASRLRRSQSRFDGLSQSTSKFTLKSPAIDSVSSSVTDLEPVIEYPANPSTSEVGQNVNVSKNSKKMASGLNVYKKESSTKQTINVCLVETDVPDSFVAAQSGSGVPETVDFSPKKEKLEIKSVKRESTVMAATCSNPFRGISGAERGSRADSSKELVHRSIQCTIFGSPDKTFVIPSAITTLLKMLAFILYEINKDEVLGVSSMEGKRIMTQVQLILGDLCKENVEKKFGFDVTYSDSKRVEKLLEDLHKYLNKVYGSRRNLKEFSENLKNVFMDLKLKELELGILNDEIQESEFLRMTEVEVKESDLKNPEVSLQNRQLESEQLLAELEFSKMELRKLQTALGEADWNIKVENDKIMTMKKSSGSRSRTDILSRKPSIQRLSTEVSRRGIRSKDFDDSRNKKKTF